MRTRRMEGTPQGWAIGTRAFLVISLASALSGCNYLILAGYLIGGPPSIDPDFDVVTNKSLTDPGVTVAVVCYAPPEILWDFDSIDSEIAKYVAFRLHQHKIRVINPDRISAWLDENDEWDAPEEIGRAFDATYVIYIDLQSFSLYEANSAHLYRGRSEAIVSVYQTDDQGGGERIYTKELLSRYPLAAPRSTYEVTYTTFKRQYLSRLSEEIGRLFYEHYNGDDIPDAT